DRRVPHRIQRLPLVFILSGRILRHDRGLLHRGHALAGWMAASVSELAARQSLGSDFLFLPRRFVSPSCCDVFLQHGPHAETSSFPCSNHRSRRIWRGSRLDRLGSVRSRSKPPRAGHFLVLHKSCRVYVHVYLVSWHVPALSF